MKQRDRQSYIIIAIFAAAVALSTILPFDFIDIGPRIIKIHDRYLIVPLQSLMLLILLIIYSSRINSLYLTLSFLIAITGILIVFVMGLSLSNALMDGYNLKSIDLFVKALIAGGFSFILGVAYKEWLNLMGKASRSIRTAVTSTRGSPQSANSYHRKIKDRSDGKDEKDIPYDRIIIEKLLLGSVPVIEYYNKESKRVKIRRGSYSVDDYKQLASQIRQIANNVVAKGEKLDLPDSLIDCGTRLIGYEIPELPDSYEYVSRFNPREEIKPIELCYHDEEFLCLKSQISHLVFSESHMPDPVDPIDDKEVKMCIIHNPDKSLKGADREYEDIKNNLDIFQEYDEDRGYPKLKIVDEEPIKPEDVIRILRQYDIVHFAGHAGEHETGTFGWKFGNFDITPADLEGLESPPKLIFDNACGQLEIQCTDKAYTSSLRALFVEKNFPNYIGTIFPVPDHLCGSFAVDFYRVLAKGKTIGEALLHARREAYHNKNPIWLAYIHIGDPSSRLWSPDDE